MFNLNPFKESKTWTLADLVLSENSRIQLRTLSTQQQQALLELLEVHDKKGDGIHGAQTEVNALWATQRREERIEQEKAKLESRTPFTVRSLNAS